MACLSHGRRELNAVCWLSVELLLWRVKPGLSHAVPVQESECRSWGLWDRPLDGTQYIIYDSPGQPAQSQGVIQIPFV